jgi:hypothetical protein
MTMSTDRVAPKNPFPYGLLCSSFYGQLTGVGKMDDHGWPEDLFASRVVKRRWDFSKRGSAEVLAKLKTFARYVPETGQFVATVARSRSPVGKILGTVDEKGRIQISIGNRPYRAHQLAWLWMTGKWPSSGIDHKNGNQADNSWNNLRLATQTVNMKNIRKRVDNTTGVTGVYFFKRDGNWTASVGVNNKSIHLGYFNSKEEAALARQRYIDTHPELGFTERHGKGY